MNGNSSTVELVKALGLDSWNRSGEATSLLGDLLRCHVPDMVNQVRTGANIHPTATHTITADGQQPITVTIEVSRRASVSDHLPPYVVTVQTSVVMQTHAAMKRSCGEHVHWDVSLPHAENGWRYSCYVHETITLVNA